MEYMETEKQPESTKPAVAWTMTEIRNGDTTELVIFPNVEEETDEAR